MYVPAELPLSSYAAPPKMNDYLPKNASAYAAPQPIAGPYASSAPVPYHPPGTQPMIGTPYHGAAPKPRAPLSPNIVENHSPQPYHQQTQQSQASSTRWQSAPQPNYQQQQQSQSSYQQDAQQNKNYQQSSMTSTQTTSSTTQKSMYDQAQSNNSSGINTVKDMRQKFSGQNISGQSQTLPRNFLSPSQQQQQQVQQSQSQSQVSYNGGSSPIDVNSKVRNASPLPFGRHATTTNKAHYENSYTKTQFHNKLYQPPKGPLQHSFVNNQRSASQHQFRTAPNVAAVNGGGAYHAQDNYYQKQQQQQQQTQHQQNYHQARPASQYDTYSHGQQQQQQQYQPQTHNTQADQQQYEHVSRSHFRTPAQQSNSGPVFRNVTNFVCFCR